MSLFVYVNRKSENYLTFAANERFACLYYILDADTRNFRTFITKYKKHYALAVVVVVNLIAEKNSMLLVRYHMQTFNKRELV